MKLTEQPTRIPVTFRDEDSSESQFCSEAIQRARSAQPGWAALPLKSRLGFIRRLRHLIAEHGLELARASARHSKRPLGEIMTAEVLPLAEACRFLERTAEKILAPRRLGSFDRPLWLRGVRSEVHREPHGIILVIGPGNYPLFLPGVQLIQALAAGNGVLLKPGAEGTEVAGDLCRLIGQAGFPAGLVAVLPDSVCAARGAIANRPDKVIFTGSASTGQEILLELAPLLIPAILELSGSDSVIVRPDADLELTAKALIFGLRLNGGATCISPRRAFVAQEIAHDLEMRLSEGLHQAATDSHAGSTESCFDTAGWLPKSRGLINEALFMGARLVAGNPEAKFPDGSPIVLCDVHTKARILKNEIFGPVLSVVPVQNDREALRLANDCSFALGASIFTRDEATARAMAAQIDAGVVTINDLIIPTADARLPFGGRRRSGFGATRGSAGLLEMSRPKVVTFTRTSFRPAFEPSEKWHPQLFRGYLRAAHGTGLTRRFAGVLDVFRAISSHAKSVSKKDL